MDAFGVYSLAFYYSRKVTGTKAWVDRSFVGLCQHIKTNACLGVSVR